MFNQLLTELLKLLAENISKEEKIKQLKSIARDTVDINGIGFYTLGAIRKTLNDEKKKSIQNYLNNISLKVFLVD